MGLILLEKSILATIAYYDVLEYPLTGFEIFKYLISPSHIIAQSEQKKDLETESVIKPEFINILKTLQSKSLENFIEEKNGFYCLRKSKLGESKENYIDKLIKTRMDRQKISDQKWKKARKIIKYLWMIPCLKAVFVSGSLALDNAKDKSDIDLLIVAKHKRIWTVRFLITLFIHIIGKRRYGDKTADRICLNHYITDESLKIDFSSLYNAQTYAHLVPILEIEEAFSSEGRGIYNKFQKANNWINSYISFYPEKKSKDRRLIKKNKFLRGLAKFQEIILNTFLGTIFEKILALFQKLIIKRHSSSAKEGRVIIDDYQLEFHPSSPEAGVLDKYNKNVLRLGFKIKPEENSGLYKKEVKSDVSRLCS